MLCTQGVHIYSKKLKKKFEAFMTKGYLKAKYFN